MLLISAGDGYFAPYIDGGYSAQPDHAAGVLILGRCGIACDSQSGIIGEGPPCDRCGDSCASEDEAHCMYDGNATWCASCYESYGFYCESCESCQECESSVTVKDSWYCQSCAENEFTQCRKCGDWDSNDASISVYVGPDCAQNDWCSSCWESFAYSCERCEDTHSHDYKSGPQSVDGMRYGPQTWCPDCADSDAFGCADCEELQTEENENEYAGQLLCESCADNHVIDAAELLAERPPARLLLPARTASKGIRERLVRLGQRFRIAA